MSLAYPPRLIKYTWSSKKERDTARTASMTPGFYGNFPSSLSLVYSRPGKDFLSQEFYITTKNAEEEGGARKPLYAVTFHKGPGLRQMTLYSTPQHGTTPLAIATTSRRYGDSVTITLPAMPGDTNSMRTERMRHKGLSSPYRFDLDGESFEWRQDNTTWPRVRRLMRLGGAKSSHSQGGKEFKIESVATWTEGSVPSRDGLLATLNFVQRSDGSSAVKELGEYFTLHALASVLAICQRGNSIEGAMSWHEEKRLEKGYRSD